MSAPLEGQDWSGLGSCRDTVWCHLGGVSARGVALQKGVCKLPEVGEGALRRGPQGGKEKEQGEEEEGWGGGGGRRQMPEDS